DGSKSVKGSTSGGASLNLSAGKASLDVTGCSTCASGAMLATNKPDYQPGDTVTFTGAGFAAGDSVTITVHEDPTWSYPDREFKSVADANAACVNRQMVMCQADLNATFTATAVGNPSGTMAQTTFTDGTVNSATISIQTVNPGPLCSGTQAASFASGSSVCASVTVILNGSGSADYRIQWYQGSNTTPIRDTPVTAPASGAIAEDIF